MNYRILWTQTAQHDLKAIVHYISQDNPHAAQQVFNRIRQAAESLMQLPLRGRAIPELRSLALAHQYRELIERPWRIIYRIDQDTVYILAVLDGRRNLDDLLQARIHRNTHS